MNILTHIHSVSQSVCDSFIAPVIHTKLQICKILLPLFVLPANLTFLSNCRRRLPPPPAGGVGVGVLAGFPAVRGFSVRPPRLAYLQQLSTLSSQLTNAINLLLIQFNTTCVSEILAKRISLHGSSSGSRSLTNIMPWE